MKINREYASAVLFSALAAYIFAATPLLSQVVNPGVPVSGSPANNDCAKFVVSGGNVQSITTAGQNCATPITPGGISGNVQTNNGLGGFAGITNTQLTALINAVTATLPGAVPAFPNNTSTYFRGDGTYVAVPFSGLTGNYTFAQGPTLGANVVLGSIAGGVIAQLTQTQLTSLCNLNSATLSGCIAAFPNNTTTFYRGDGTYATLNFAALGGQTTLAQLPTMAANTVLSNWTAAGATPLANVWPACANDGGHSLVYVNGTGLVCATLSAALSTTIAQGNGITVAGNCAPLTNAGTCTITNGAAAVSGAVKSNGSGTFTQAATTDLSDVTAPASCTVTDQSGASLSITSTDCKFTKIGKVITWAFNITYPVTASGATATISIPAAPISLSGADQTCLVFFPSISLSIYGVISNSTSTMQFYNPTAAVTRFANSNLTTANIAGSCTYLAN